MEIKSYLLIHKKKGNNKSYFLNLKPLKANIELKEKPVIQSLKNEFPANILKLLK